MLRPGLERLAVIAGLVLTIVIAWYLLTNVLG